MKLFAMWKELEGTMFNEVRRTHIEGQGSAQ